MVAGRPREERLLDGLRRPATHPGDLQDPVSLPGAGTVDGFGSQGQHGLKQAHRRIPDLKLGAMHPHGQPARARVNIVAGQRTLVPLRKLTLGV